MKSVFQKPIVVALGLLFSALSGCGGGGSTPPLNSGNGTRGTVTMQIRWPQPVASRAANLAVTRGRTRGSGAIPQGTRAITIRLTNPTTSADLAPARTLIAPDANLADTQTVSFSDISVGPVHVDVRAFSDAAAAQPAIAIGSADGTVAANASTTIQVPVTVTATRITISPSPVTLSLSPGPSTQILTATVFDISNNQLTYPLQWAITTPDPPITLMPSADLATITLISSLSGDATVTVTEPTSGLSASVSVTVLPPGRSRQQVSTNSSAR